MQKTRSLSSGPSYSILLVDDNRNGLMARKALLDEAGYRTTAESSPEAALEKFKTERFDLLVTDYRMPRMNGTELIAHIREIKSNLPVIMVSALVESHGLTEKNTGADAVLPKSSTEVQHLVRTVARLLRRAAPRKPVRSQSAAARAKSGAAH